MTAKSPIVRLSKKEAARHLANLLRGSDGKSFTPQAITKWMRERRLPYLKFGRQVTFDPAQLDEWATRTFARNQRPTLK